MTGSFVLFVVLAVLLLVLLQTHLEPYRSPAPLTGRYIVQFRGSYMGSKPYYIPASMTHPANVNEWLQHKNTGVGLAVLIALMYKYNKQRKYLDYKHPKQFTQWLRDMALPTSEFQTSFRTVRDKATIPEIKAWSGLVLELSGKLANLMRGTSLVWVKSG